MTCAQFVAALSIVRRARAPAPAVEEHALGCPHCHALWQADQWLRETDQHNPALTLPDELQRVLLSHRGSTRVSGTSMRFLAVLISCAACLLCALAFVPRQDLQIAFQPWVLEPFLALAALMLATLTLFLYRGRTGLGAPPWLRWSTVALGLLGFNVLCALQAKFWWGPSPAVGTFAAPRDCLVLGSAVALLMGISTFAVSRYSALVAPAAAGALGGCSAGLSAVLFLHLHCPSHFGLHLHVVHTFPLLLAIGLGALLGRRWLAA